MVAAVADGAGMAALAEVGSRLAAQRAVEALVAGLPEHGDASGFALTDDECRRLLTAAFAQARDCVKTEADLRGASPRDLATTLTVALATADFVATAQIGDGAAIVGGAEGLLIALSTPPHGEYINETTFLTSDDAVETLAPVVWRGKADHVGILSDGLQMVALRMPDATPHAPFFAPLFRFVREAADDQGACEDLVAFLRSPRVTARCDDDLTLLVATLIR